MKEKQEAKKKEIIKNGGTLKLLIMSLNLFSFLKKRKICVPGKDYIFF
jgi:hypothetical protein